MDLREIYNKNMVWAVVGDIQNPQKYAYKILRNFQIKGYNVVGVTPYGNEKTFKTLSQVDLNIEAVNLCVNPRRGLDLLENDQRHNIKYVIAQPGAESESLRAYCKEREIVYIEACTLATLG